MVKLIMLGKYKFNFVIQITKLTSNNNQDFPVVINIFADMPCTFLCYQYECFRLV